MKKSALVFMLLLASFGVALAETNERYVTLYTNEKEVGFEELSCTVIYYNFNSGPAKLMDLIKENMQANKKQDYIIKEVRFDMSKWHFYVFFKDLTPKQQKK